MSLFTQVLCTPARGELAPIIQHANGELQLERAYVSPRVYDRRHLGPGNSDAELLGPALLVYPVYKTAKMRSNQSCTGLLYVAIIAVFIGELLAEYLQTAGKFPA